MNSSQILLQLASDWFIALFVPHVIGQSDFIAIFKNFHCPSIESPLGGNEARRKGTELEYG